MVRPRAPGPGAGTTSLVGMILFPVGPAGRVQACATLIASRSAAANGCSCMASAGATCRGFYRQTLSQGAKGRGWVQVDIDLKNFGERSGQAKSLRARFIHMLQVCFGENSRERSCTSECGRPVKRSAAQLRSARCLCAQRALTADRSLQSSTAIAGGARRVCKMTQLRSAAATRALRWASGRSSIA